MAQEIEALVDGGKASAGPPLGPALGPAGVNVMDVVQAINEKTKDFEGMKVPVTVVIDDKKKFEIKVGTPPTSALLFQQADHDKGSGMPNVDKVADITVEQAVKVAKQKLDDLLGASLKARTKEVLGTARSMGFTCEGKDPRTVQQEISAGRHDSKFE
ncbi:MAG: 50S ribosomal protein L11 [Candidatus Thermoplasmatota archaeon]|nr:50S ribosomal protein L11 [Candidatus Thermoplasmatota archaeon]